MSQLHIATSPHIHTNKTTTSIMLDVIIALLPATVAGFLIFGLKALSVVMMCIAVSVLSEFIFNKIVKKEDTTSDLSAVVTGLLLGLNLPADTPLWQAAVGSIFAIVVVKCIFGGIGCNLVNPAITARVFMLIAFTSLAKPSFPVDSVATATPLVDLSAGKTPDMLELFLGNIGGAIGETSKLALLIGGIYLICRKVISPVMPLSYIGTVFVFTFLVKDFSLTAALYQILSGGLFIGAFFMATDYVTSPSTDKGRLIFGIGAGVITVLIRLWGAYPEGVSFAILFMNILNPYVNAWSRRKLFGRDK